MAQSESLKRTLHSHHGLTIGEALHNLMRRYWIDEITWTEVQEFLGHVGEDGLDLSANDLVPSIEGDEPEPTQRTRQAQEFLRSSRGEYVAVGEGRATCHTQLHLDSNGMVVFYDDEGDSFAILDAENMLNQLRADRRDYDTAMSKYNEQRAAQDD